MDRKELMTAFNKQPRLGALSTADREGNLNSAVFSALNMIDEQTVVLASGENRSLANMRSNGKAVFIFFEPGQTPFDWKGARLYMDVAGIEAQGPLFDNLVEAVRAEVGDYAAQNVKAAVSFTITDVRPLIDAPAG